ncbi:hypothetical protein F4820DRAFT_431580 [Hypoxylon rubiginosum]|uniref:Uncharacterized protein n=1 Tax=Hypoxylon rubiginosum TaxID=110542 RepID=A0ACB9YRS0_9PEZI|nr:hypothetical protein F4820DRAFT_431580 [Hypoxylon rubiginosum]
MSADHDSETETFEGDSGFETDPGATIMWFGIFKGTRLDELPDHYRWALVRFARERPCPILNGFKDLHEEYMSWTDATQSPMSTTVWFGRYKGYELRVLYARPKVWWWLVENCVWGPELESIEQRYLARKRVKEPPT